MDRNEKMEWNDSLPHNHENIASKFDLNYKQLSKLIYPDTRKSYRSFDIAKKSGGTRTIHAPKIKLLRIQQKLAEELSNAYKPRQGCHGFVKKRSIVSNASRHVNKTYVFNIDLEDFFGSIHFGRVRNLLMSWPLNYSHETATILAQICCHCGVLPQGAPTSPVISNMICWKLDAQLQTLASRCNCTYTRYADDITFSFSCSKVNLPETIVKIDSDGFVFVGQTLTDTIAQNGFTINHKKVRLRGRSQRQEVTGITVNKITNVKRSFVRQTSSMLYAWKKFGAVKAEQQYLAKYRAKDLAEWQKRILKNPNGEFFIGVVKGRINYIQMIKGRYDPVYKKLAFRLTEALGKPNEDFTRSPEELIAKSTFVIDNSITVAQGSGFLLSDIGVVTNEHVASQIQHDNDDCLDIYRYFEVANKRRGRFVYSSKKRDLAIFKPDDSFNDVPSLKIGDDSNLRIGDRITVIGYPGFSDSASPYISSGSIVQRRRFFDLHVWIVDIPITHGCSGAPILNDKYEVIGIATFGSETNDGSTDFNGFIPISTLTSLLHSATYKKSLLSAKSTKAVKH